MYFGQVTRVRQEAQFDMRFDLLRRTLRSLEIADEPNAEELAVFEAELADTIEQLEKLEIVHLRGRYQTEIATDMLSLDTRDYRQQRGNAIVKIGQFLGMLTLFRNGGSLSEFWCKDRWLGAHLAQLQDVFRQDPASYILFCRSLTEPGLVFTLFLFSVTLRQNVCILGQLTITSLS